MRYREFGRTGVRVSQLTLGTGMLGAAKDGSTDPGRAAALLEMYAEAGGNCLDISDAYQGGRSEELIGEWLRDRRDAIVLVSKYTRTPDRAALPARTGNHRKAMLQSVQASLKRLRVDHIDLYFAHLDDGVTPMEEIMRGFDDLVRQGMILYGGLSNFPAWRTAKAAVLAELRGWAPLAGIEVEYGLLHRTVEREILPLARDMGLGVLSYSALAAGLLSGKRGNDPRSASRLGVASEADVDGVLAAVQGVAEEQEVDAASVALAWVAAKGCFPILGVRDTTQLAENLRSVDVTLSPEQLLRREAASTISLGYPGDLLAAFQATR